MVDTDEQNAKQDEAVSQMMFGQRDPRLAPVKFKEPSSPIEGNIELFQKMITPTRAVNSNAHEYVVNDPALSNLPNEEYAELMADYMRVSTIFKELGYEKIGNKIHAEMEGRAWALMGVKGWLRRMLNTTRGEFVKTENKSSSGIPNPLDRIR
jgi:hypothetical protein